MTAITKHEWELILESLRHSKRAIESCDHHPSYDFKRKQIDELTRVQEKARVAIRSAPKIDGASAS